MKGRPVVMVKSRNGDALNGDSSLGRLRHVLSEAKPGRAVSASVEDLREVESRLERLRREFPALAKTVELNVALVRAGQNLDRDPRGADPFDRDGRS